MLIGRRPDLPFGWLLAGAAYGLTVAVLTVIPALAAVAAGDLDPARCGACGCRGVLPAGRYSGSDQHPVSEWTSDGPVRAGPGRGAVGRATAPPILSAVFGSGHARDLCRRPQWISRSQPVGGAVVGAVADVMVDGPGPGAVGPRRRYRRRRALRARDGASSASNSSGGPPASCSALALFPLAVTERLGGVVNAASTARCSWPRWRSRCSATGSGRSTRSSAGPAAYAAVTVVLVAGYALIAAPAPGSPRSGSAAGLAGGAPQCSPSPRCGGAASGWWTGCSTASATTRTRCSATWAAAGCGRGAGCDPARRGRAVAGTLRLPYVRIEGPDGAVLAGQGEAGGPGRAVGAGVPGHADGGASHVAAPGRGPCSMPGTGRCSTSWPGKPVRRSGPRR